MKTYETQLHKLEEHAKELAKAHQSVSQEMREFKERWNATFAFIGKFLLIDILLFTLCM